MLSLVLCAAVGSVDSVSGAGRGGVGPGPGLALTYPQPPPAEQHKSRPQSPHTEHYVCTITTFDQPAVDHKTGSERFLEAERLQGMSMSVSKPTEAHLPHPLPWANRTRNQPCLP